MSKLTIAGVASWFIAGLLLGFQAISTLMQTGDKYGQYTKNPGMCPQFQ